MFDNAKPLCWMGILCGLIGSAAWWLLSVDSPESFIVIGFSTFLGGFLSGWLAWHWILRRPEKVNVLRGVIAGGLTGFIFHIPSAIISVILTLLFQYNVPLEKRAVMGFFYLIGGIVAPLYMAPITFVCSMASVGGVVAYFQKRKEARRPFC